MKYKWVIMQELEDTNIAIPYRIVNDEERAEQLCQELEDTDCANPYLIVDTEERAEELCYKLESENPGFIFWSYLCEEE